MFCSFSNNLMPYLLLGYLGIGKLKFVLLSQLKILSLLSKNVIFVRILLLLLFRIEIEYFRFSLWCLNLRIVLIRLLKIREYILHSLRNWLKLSLFSKFFQNFKIFWPVVLLFALYFQFLSILIVDLKALL